MTIVIGGYPLKLEVRFLSRPTKNNNVSRKTKATGVRGSSPGEGPVPATGMAFAIANTLNKGEKMSQEIVKKWNALETDKERWLYVLNHPEQIVIRLDNDDTYASLSDDFVDDNDDYDFDLFGFDYWIGNAPGLQDFFEVLLPKIRIESF